MYWHRLILRRFYFSPLFCRIFRKVYTPLSPSLSSNGQILSNARGRLISPILRASDIFYHAMRYTFGLVVFMKETLLDRVAWPFLDTREIYSRNNGEFRV